MVQCIIVSFLYSAFLMDPIQFERYSGSNISYILNAVEEIETDFPDQNFNLIDFNIEKYNDINITYIAFKRIDNEISNPLVSDDITFVAVECDENYNCFIFAFDTHGYRNE